MTFQIIRMRGHTPTSEVGWTRTNQTPDRTDFRCYKAAVAQRAGAKRNINAILDKVQATIREDQANIYAWVLLKKIRDDGKKIQPPKRNRCGQEQFSLGHLKLAGCVAFG